MTEVAKGSALKVGGQGSGGGPRSRAAARDCLLFWHDQLAGQLIEPS
jgi:hypothetical protein